MDPMQTAASDFPVVLAEAAASRLLEARSSSNPRVGRGVAVAVGRGSGVDAGAGCAGVNDGVAVAAVTLASRDSSKAAALERARAKYVNDGMTLGTQIIGFPMVPSRATTERVANYQVVEFKRSLASFRAALQQEESLSQCRAALLMHGMCVQFAGGCHIWARPDQYDAIVHDLMVNGIKFCGGPVFVLEALKFRHIIASEKYASMVLAAAAKLRSVENVKPKRYAEGTAISVALVSV